MQVQELYYIELSQKTEHFSNTFFFYEYICQYLAALLMTTLIIVVPKTNVESRQLVAVTSCFKAAVSRTTFHYFDEARMRSDHFFQLVSAFDLCRLGTGGLFWKECL